MTRDHAQHVTRWLNDLAALTAGNTPLADAREKIAALTATIGDEFPPEAFTRASLRDIAAETTFFPAYATLRKALALWWRDHKPQQAALPGKSLADEIERKASIWIKRRDSDSIPDLANSLDMLRNHSEAVFNHLIRTDEQARSIATSRGWTQPETADDWADLTEISVTQKLIEIEKMHAKSPAIAAAYLSLLRKVVGIHAPQLAHMLPERFGSPDQKPRTQAEQLAALGIQPPPQPMTAAERFEAIHGRKPGTLTPEQLAILRQQARAPTP